MHEMSLLSDLMRKILEIAHKENAKKVATVKVKLGALSHLSADHFTEHFLQISEGTLAEGAKLDIEELTDEKDPNAQEIILDSITVED